MSEIKNKTPELNQQEAREKIVSGRGMEVIAEQGWPAFREILLTLNYSDIVSSEVTKIRELVSQADLSEVYGAPAAKEREAIWANKTRLREEVAGENGLIARYTSAFPVREMFNYDSNPHAYYAARYPSLNKFIVEGNFGCNASAREKISKQGSALKRPLFRLYITTPYDKTAKIFESLLQKFTATKLEKGYPSGREQDRELINYVDLILNLPSVLNISEQSAYYRNAIFISSHPVAAKMAMDKVAQVFLELQRSSPEIFQLEPRYQAQERIETIKDLMVPLGNAGYAEIPYINEAYQSFDLLGMNRQLALGHGLPIDRWGWTKYNSDSFKFALDQLEHLEKRLRSLGQGPEKGFKIPFRKFSMPSLVIED